MRELKICQIAIGGEISIPPKNWGAIEKVIWNYKLQLEKMGHVCDIKMPWEVKDENGECAYDIIHVHSANQCVDDMVKYQQVQYVYSMHDHHTYKYGKDSWLYKHNLSAIKQSIVSFTFSEFFVKYFEETDKLFFMSHGVDTEVYKFKNNPIDGHKLLCVANNGYSGDSSYDRKGFRYAIEAAMKLGLPISIVGPKNNDRFFEENKDLLKYDKLNIIYEPSEPELVDIFNDHTIFLHPSELEVGHPNLTLLEAMSCGLPIVGTCEVELEGMEKSSRDTDSVYIKIKKVIDNYEYYRKGALKTAKKLDWSNVVSILENSYQNICNINDDYTHDLFKDKLKYLYSISDKKIHEPKVTIKINFNKQAFVEVKCSKDKSYDVSIIDKDNNRVEYQNKLNSNMWAKSNINYYKNWRVTIKYDDKEIIKDFEPFDKNVLISMDSKSLGDTIAWFPYVEEFRLKHKCNMYCSTFHNYLFEKEYPEINFINPGESIPNSYATYEIGWFSPPWGGTRDRNPIDYRTIPLQKTCSDILGLEYKEMKPKMYIPDGESPIVEKYVCIAHHSTAGAKLWHNDGAWQKIVDFLNRSGYKVMVIQKEGTNLDPRTIINETGNQPLTNRMNQLKHCEFFIGVGSGLSWLAWAVGKKVVMISGFSKPWCEFTTDVIRIHNSGVCNGCFNDVKFEFDKGDWNWCPAHKGTHRMFECTKSITPEHVIERIKQSGLF